jgi:ATP-dependent RNA helicase RhlB
VIDEADRMFDLGFIKDVRYLLRKMPPREERQGMLFSATLSYRVLELAYEHMNQPEKLSVETEHVTADRVRQQVYFPAKEEKIPLLLNLLEHCNPQRSIVFVNTRAAAERVTDRLKRQGFKVGALSGDVPQAKRQKLLERFKKGEADVLVATDVAARGLHIPDVTHVFNYDLPQDGEDYVHRIGRTARLGAEGDAISFACDLYAMNLPDIERYIDMKIPVSTVEPAWLVPPSPRAKPQLEHPEPEAETPATSAGAPAAHKRRRRRRKPGDAHAAPPTAGG